MDVALIVLLPFLGACVPPLTARSGRNVCAGATAAVTFAALLLLLARAPAVFSGEVVAWGVPWVPQIGLSFSFFIDGLGLFFAALILGIGLLIILYARFYLSREDPIGKFYAYLLLFQGAMVGIVLSDNLLLLIVFWELTSLTSFLLIGYWRHLPQARQGARMALVVTGGGGLALIGGMLLLGQIAGSYQLSEILARGDIGQGLAALSAGAAADPDRRVHEIGAVSVSFLAAARDVGADPGVGLSALGDDGQGRRLSARAAVAGSGRHRDRGS